MIKYTKLFTLLAERGMKKTDLLNVISAPTLAKLSKGEVVKMDVIEKICKYLGCQPGDIMEYINDEILLKKAEALDEAQNKALESLFEQGYTEEMLRKLLHESVDVYLKDLFTNGNATTVGVKNLLDELKNQEI